MSYSDFKRMYDDRFFPSDIKSVIEYVNMNVPVE